MLTVIFWVTLERIGAYIEPKLQVHKNPKNTLTKYLQSGVKPTTSLTKMDLPPSLKIEVIERLLDDFLSVNMAFGLRFVKKCPFV